MNNITETSFEDRKGSGFESRATSDVAKKKLDIKNERDIVGNIKKVIMGKKNIKEQTSDESEVPSNADNEVEQEKEIIKKNKQKMNSRIVNKDENEDMIFTKEEILERLQELADAKLDALKVSLALKEKISFEYEPLDEATKKEAEEILGGPVKQKPKMPPGKQPAGYRYVRRLARKAMKKAMKEEVEQVDEAKNKPYIRPFRSASGDVGWKAMNKHGKTQYFNNKAAAEKHAGEGFRELQEETEQLDEASNVIKAGRTKIIKVRVRKGKVQRRKKVSAVKGYTVRGGKLTRMKASERLKRKIGQRRGKMKRKAKLARALMRRKRSMRKRASLGLKE